MKEQYIIFFDGQCNLCSQFINFTFKRDKKRQLFYALLQGQTAKKYLGKEDTEKIKSIVFLRKKKKLKEAPAIKAILQQIYPRWSPAFSIIPAEFFNFLYKFIAQRRYSFFGKKDKLYSPSQDQKAYFLP